ncbi:MAG: cell division protein ZapA [Muribaculaceae bacterium]|nr:cell division protein ZapA [Muribaculaceae bacterium]
MKDKLNITIRIAEQAPLQMNINPAEEEYIRKAEESVNHLWKLWSARFDMRSEELMAMIAFQFAKLYTFQKERENQALLAVEALDKEMAELISAIDGKNASRQSRKSDAPGAKDHPSLL